MSGTTATTYIVVANKNEQISGSLSPTGTFSQRTLGSRASDTLNIMDYGVPMNTTSDVSALLVDIVNSTTLESIYITVPSGTLVADTFSGANSILSFFDFGGTVVDQSTTQAVTSLGDGAIVKAFSSAGLQFTKEITLNTHGAANTQFTLIHNGSTTSYNWTDIAGNLVVSGTSTPECAGQVWNAAVYLTASSTTETDVTINGIGTTAVPGAINLTSYVTLPYPNKQPTWQYYGHTDDRTGQPVGSSFAGAGLIGSELDISVNGAEGTATAYDPKSGGRAIMLVKAKGYIPNVWAGGTNYKYGDLIATAAGTLSNGYVYICTTAGISGSSPPTWSTTLGAFNPDGGVTWSTGGTIPAQVSRGLEIGSEYASIAAGILIHDTIYGAAIDLSSVVPASTAVAGLRLPHDLGIDFSGQTVSAASMNQHVLLWNSASTSLEYLVSGTSVLIIEDNGSVIIDGGIAASSGISAGGNVTAANIITTGTITAEDVVVTGGISASGTISAGDINTSGTFLGDIVTLSGDLSAENITASGSITVTGTGAVSAQKFIAVGDMIAGGDLQAPNVTISQNATVTGNVKANELIALANASIAGSLIMYTATVASNATIDGNLTLADSFNYASVFIDSSTVVNTPSSGGTISIPGGCSTYVLAGSGTLAALTVNLPSGTNNQIIKIIPQIAVTAFTLTSSGPSVIGGPSAAAPGSWIQKQLTNGHWC